MKITLNKINSIKLKIDDIKNKYKTMILKSIKFCCHPKESIAYCYEGWGYRGSPSYRICTLCGLAEDGWGFSALLPYAVTYEKSIQHHDAFDIMTCYLNRNEVDCVQKDINLMESIILDNIRAHHIGL